MKKTIKKLVEVILTIIACTSLILMCAEKPDGGVANLLNRNGDGFTLFHVDDPLSE